VDVAFVRAPSHVMPRDVVARRFSSARLLVALPSDHRLAAQPVLTLGDLKDEAFILLQDPHGLGLGHHIMELCEAAGFTPRSELSLQNLTVAVGLVAAGLGVSVVPEAVARTAPPGVACRLLDVEAATSQVWIAHKAGVPSPVLAQFLSLANWPAIVRRAD
jgi:DNA-binding transcriptional LysR family regulator